jgi:glycosyltransferase involved in cell wall biosynthesis
MMKFSRQNLSQADPTLTDAVLVSVVINNYNYGRFLRDAIKSVLHQTYPQVELIIVDDGSTDHSRAIISEYEGRLISVFKQNGGQASALNAGFRVSRGAIVIFLDADDYLFPHAADQLVKVWKPELSKIHYRLEVVDRTGKKLGIHPSIRQKLVRGNVVDSLVQNGRYFTSVTSGNAFNRSTLEQVMPMPEDEFRLAADGYLNVVTPFYGDIEAIEVPLGAYRMHGENLWAMPTQDTGKIQQMIEHDFVRYRYLEPAAKQQGYSVPQNLWTQDYTHLKYRLLLKILDQSTSGSILDLFSKSIITIFSNASSPLSYKLYCLLYLVREVARSYAKSRWGQSQ